MLRYLMIFGALAPSGALAHGVHLPAATHELAHTAPLLAVAAVAIGALAWLLWRARA